MKRQIHAFRGHADVTVPGHDVKLGRGGIREIEFFVQTQQLIFGGRRPSLRGAATLDMLAELQADGWIDEVAASELTVAYRFLRRIEHRLQMIADEQTQRCRSRPMPWCSSPSSPATTITPGSKPISCGRCAIVESPLRAALRTCRRPSMPQPGIWSSRARRSIPRRSKPSGSSAFSKPAEAVEIVRGWHFGRRPAVRGARAREVLTELVPALLSAFSASGDPDAALDGFDTALGRMPAAVELFSILRSNAALRQLFADILGVAPRLAATVTSRPHLLDAAIDPAGRSTTPDEIQARVASPSRRPREPMACDVTEEVLDRARDIAREEQFLIGLRLLAGSEDPARAGEHYADLAGAIVRALLSQVAADFEAEHGTRSRRRPGGRRHGQVRISRDDRRLRSRSPDHLRLRSRDTPTATDRGLSRHPATTRGSPNGSSRP